MTPTEWPASSPDLVPCDYRLWKWFSDHVYEAGNSATEAELKRRIRIAWEEQEEQPDRAATSYDGSLNFFLGSALLSHMKAGKFNNLIAYDFVIN
ncbi:hypothetical protein L596_007593 [Steinernema carpocapsae]|uniref:Uncharacterized protein n=1 Tax=Steinernema carpocapsae TaxID=34508 RepID=A0A4U5PAE4_STECR|nr:hypothetical protein L596_007593 [Steinernema carpocapsae]